MFGLIQDSPEAFLLLGDSVEDKRYSRFIELVKLQYSGAEHDLVRGIGMVNLVHSAGDKKDFYPIDYRIYAPDQDGKTKNGHFAEMLINAVYAKKIKAKDKHIELLHIQPGNLPRMTTSSASIEHSERKF